MRRPALFVLALALAPSLSPAVALAQDAEPIAVDYQVPGTCPSSDWFLGEVRGRTPRARPASTGERARVLVVRIEGTTGGYVGRLSIDDAGTRSTPRELRGATCSEVASALALVGALAVDPQASTAPRPAPPEPEPPPAPPPTPPASAPASASASASAPASASASASAPASASPPPPPPSSPSTKRSEPTFAAGAGAELAAWSGAVASLRLFGDLSFGHPTFRLALARSLDVERTAIVGGATLTWTTVSGAFCPLRIAIAGDDLGLRPCAELAGGVLDAEGVSVTQAQARTRPWLTAAAHGRLVWALARGFALELEGGAMAPFFRESFFFAPGIPVYEAPAVVGFGRIAASVRFP